MLPDREEVRDAEAGFDEPPGARARNTGAHLLVNRISRLFARNFGVCWITVHSPGHTSPKRLPDVRWGSGASGPDGIGPVRDRRKTFSHKSENFNPLDDATVRKLASQLRHKLDEYYAGDGSADRVVISLPRRMYLPRFRFREPTVSTALPAKSTGPNGRGLTALAAGERGGNPVEAGQSVVSNLLPPSRRLLWLVGAVLCIGVLSILVWRAGRSRVRSASVESFQLAPVVISTTRGDMRGPGLDVTPGAVRLGPPVADGLRGHGANGFRARVRRSAGRHHGVSEP